VDNYLIILHKFFFLCKFVALYNEMKKVLFIAIILLLSLLGIKAQQNFTVIIDPGHGGKDPGCLGPRVHEKVINLAVAQMVGELIELNHPNVKVVYTRKSDVFIPLDERAAIANRNKGDLFISIHVNSVKRGNASGAETYTLGLSRSDENLEVAMRENAVILMEDNYLGKYEGFDPTSSESYIIFEFMQNTHIEQSVSFASEIQKEFVKAHRSNRDVRQGGFLVLRKTSMPSVLIELGFMSNSEEERFLASERGQIEFAISIYLAFANYKREYDRKSGSMADIQVEKPMTRISSMPAGSAGRTTTAKTTNSTPAKNTGNTSPSTTPSSKQDEIIYKVQILTSDKLLSTKDKRFKGYSDISYYQEKGIYKYTYGATSDYSKILQLYRKASKDFKDAFIIKTKNGKRL